MSSRLYLVVIFIVPSFFVNAQEHPDSVRGRYVQEFKDHFFLWPVLKQRSLNFEVRSSQQNKNVVFQPNTSFALGVGAYVFDLAIEVAYAIPINEKSSYLYGTSKARDLQVNALAKRWGADLYYQKYAGFYESSGDSDRKTKPFPQRADISTRNVGVAGLYVFNPWKYSMKSAFTFAERQLKSGGSVIIAGTLNGFKLQADSAVLDTVYLKQFGKSDRFQDLRYTTLSFAPGYAYNFIFRDFFLSGALTLGPAHNWIYYRNQDEAAKNDIRINTFVSIRMGLGYNSDRFFAGVNFTRQSRAVKFDEVQFTNSSTTFKLLVGYRFREFGILKKSAKDLSKKLLTKTSS